MALRIFRQQAIALGRVFSVAAKFTDPDVYFVGGGVHREAAPRFRDWFLATVREHTGLFAEQAAVEEITPWSRTWTWQAHVGSLRPGRRGLASPAPLVVRVARVLEDEAADFQVELLRVGQVADVPQRLVLAGGLHDELPISEDTAPW